MRVKVQSLEQPDHLSAKLQRKSFVIFPNLYGSIKTASPSCSSVKTEINKSSEKTDVSSSPPVKRNNSSNSTERASTSNRTSFYDPQNDSSYSPDMKKKMIANDMSAEDSFVSNYSGSESTRYSLNNRSVRSSQASDISGVIRAVTSTSSNLVRAKTLPAHSGNLSVDNHAKQSMPAQKDFYSPSSMRRYKPVVLQSLSCEDDDNETKIYLEKIQREGANAYESIPQTSVNINDFKIMSHIGRGYLSDVFLAKFEPPTDSMASKVPNNIDPSKEMKSFKIYTIKAIKKGKIESKSDGKNYSSYIFSIPKLT
jgi:hypothetical protein